jgi:hypothetical protein
MHLRTDFHDKHEPVGGCVASAASGILKRPKRSATDITNEVREMRSAIARAERASEAGATGGRNHPKVSLGAKSASKLKPPKERTRTAVAKEAGLPERKVRLAQEIKKAARKCPQWCG